MENCDRLLAVLRNDAAAQEWAGTCASLKSAFEKLPADAKAALVAGDNCVPALLLAIGRQGSSGGDDWAAVSSGACEALNALVTGLPKGAKQALLSSQKGVALVAAIIARLESEDAHICWKESMRLLKRLVYQEASLSHINFCTLDFLKKECGLMAVLLRCSRGFSTDADNKVFHSACGALVVLSFSVANPPSVPISLEIVTLFVAAVQLCSYEPALKTFGTAMSNFSENVSHCSVLAQAKCHQYALSKIAGFNAADNVWSDPISVETLSLSLIVNMSRNDALHAELKQSRVIEILTPLADPSCKAQLRVLMAMSYIIGCKESSGKSASGTSALTQLANSTSIGKIIDCLENTLNLKGGPGYGFGFIILPAILQVWRRHVLWFNLKTVRLFFNSCIGACRTKLQRQQQTHHGQRAPDAAADAIAALVR